MAGGAETGGAGCPENGDRSQGEPAVRRTEGKDCGERVEDEPGGGEQGGGRTRGQVKEKPHMSDKTPRSAVLRISIRQ